VGKCAKLPDNHRTIRNIKRLIGVLKINSGRWGNGLLIVEKDTVDQDSYVLSQILDRPSITRYYVIKDPDLPDNPIDAGF
jgi:hypothetical protein